MTKVTKSTSYRKIKKLERSKVKIKSHKTPLPKGQNVTDTNFKVKKIIIKDQVHSHKEGELLSKKKLSCQELLGRLTHHNVAIKLDALSGLKELITEFSEQILETNLAPLIESISKLTLDESKDIRKESNTLLSVMLSKAPLRNLAPLFPSLSSYLICGITHIDNAIREDSLLLLDSLLKWTPSLCISSASKLLPICLDLISNSTANSRTLSVNLESKFTSGRWRGNVLARISTLLTVLLDSYKETSENEIVSSKVTINMSNKRFYENGKMYILLNQSNINYNFDDHKLFSNSSTHKSVDSKSFKVKDFTEALVPLLFGAFIELVPVEDNDIRNKTGTTISLEVSLILKHIVEIVNSLWELLKAVEPSCENEKWFKNKFSKPFMYSLVTGRFPYSIVLSEEDKRKKKLLLVNVNSPSCHAQNILLAKLILTLNEPPLWDAAIVYLKNCLRLSDSFERNECSQLISCCQTICLSPCKDTKAFLANLDKLSLSRNSYLSSQAMSAFYNIAIDSSLTSLHNDPNFQSWLESLPERLTKTSVSSKVLDIIYEIARRNFPAFSTALDGLIEVILDNLPNLKVDDGLNNKEGCLKVAQLLFWVRDWDNEMLESLKKAIENVYWGPSITKQIKDIYSIKFQNVI